ncbi:ABC transporter permease [Lysinibacillus sp. ZYM-1]|uniref:ABC transporter permease n=1 Tax=Lysinibacillus sp. ZYM-1 TaxID=1681184 RepID=UPI0006CE79D1|nr:ABC transporter permease [Lysinibacillus sp. ZYM-1]KPN93251.1 hypothetical protein AO843_07200 [Lysinibacillus sp. ZYM-1]
MKILWLAIKDIKLTFFDWKAVLILVITPLLLVLILGYALAGVFEDKQIIEKFTVAVVLNHPNNESENLIKQVEQHANQYIHLKEMNQEEAKTEVKSGEIPVMVTVSGDLQKADSIVIQHNIKAELQGKITEQVFNQIIQSSRLLGQAYKATGNTNAVPYQKEDHMETEDISETLFIENSSANDGKIVSSFQYYAAGISVMFILLTGMSGLSSIIEEKKLGTYSRIRMTYTSLPSFIIGKWLSTTATCLLQFFILILGTSLIFNISWGNHLGVLFLLMLAYVFAIGGIVIFLTIFIQTETMANIIRGVGVQIMVLLGGSMIPIHTFPEMLQYAAYITPNYWAQNGLLNLMGGRGFSSITVELLVLFCIGLLTFSIGFIRLSKGEEGNLG